jgi:hypothetical protein
MVSLTLVLIVLAFLIAIAAGIGRAPLWVSVVLLALADLLAHYPR